MKNLALQRCHNHGQREAVALCPECAVYYCRECIVEHEDRVLCASCLARLLAGAAARRSRLAGFVSAGRFLLGFLMLWMTFYYLAQMLLSLPTAFHEGTVWEETWPEKE